MRVLVAEIDAVRGAWLELGTLVPERVSALGRLLRVAPQAIEPGHHQHVTGLQPVEQFQEPGAHGGGHGATDGSLNEAGGLDGKTGGLDVLALMPGGLVEHRHPTVSKHA